MRATPEMWALVLLVAGCQDTPEPPSEATPAPAYTPEPVDVCSVRKHSFPHRALGASDLDSCGVSGSDTQELAAAATLLPHLGVSGQVMDPLSRIPRGWSPSRIAVDNMYRGVFDRAPLTERRNDSAETYDFLWVEVMLADGRQRSASLVPLCNGWRALCVSGVVPVAADFECGSTASKGCVAVSTRDPTDTSWVAAFPDRICAAGAFEALDQTPSSRRLPDPGGGAGATFRACELFENGERQLSMAREMGILGH